MTGPERRPLWLAFPAIALAAVLLWGHLFVTYQLIVLWPAPTLTVLAVSTAIIVAAIAHTQRARP
jgi:hypothetical protein